MTGRIAKHVRDMLAVTLALTLVVALVLSSNSRMLSHDRLALAQIVAEHHAEVEAHGHAHADFADLMQAFHGHAHEITDHDHNIAFLPPRVVMADRRDFGLDRPPRL